MFLRLVAIGIVSSGLVGCGADNEQFDDSDIHSVDALNARPSNLLSAQPFSLKRPEQPDIKRLAPSDKSPFKRATTRRASSQLETLQLLLEAHQPMLRQLTILGRWVQTQSTAALAQKTARAISHAWKHSGRVITICNGNYGINATAVECLNDDSTLNLSLLSLLPNLRELKLYGVTVIDWAPLAKLNRLQSLEILCEDPQRDVHWSHVELLGECRNPDATSRPAVATLGQLKELRVLIMDIWPTDESGDINLQPLKRLTTLHNLQLNSQDRLEVAEDPNAADGMFAKLYGLGVLSNLKSLKLIGVTVAEPQVHLPTLVKLELPNTNARTTKALTVRNPKIRHLKLEYASQEAANGALKTLRELNVLELTGSDIKSLANVAKNSRLTSLNIARTDLCDLTHLGELTHLRALNASAICRTENANVDFSPLDKLSHLKSLDISNNSIRSHKWISALKLRALTMSGAKSIDISQLLPLRDSLVALDITAHEDSVKSFKKLKHFRKLKKLSMSSDDLYQCARQGGVHNSRFKIIRTLKALKVLTVDDELPCYQLDEDEEKNNETTQGLCVGNACKELNRLEKRGIRVESTFEEPGC